MQTATLSDLLRCHVGVGPDPRRVGLVLDYRGDHPPIGLFELLRQFGWLTPAPHAPPARAIDWDHPDPDAGRSWSLRPFVVTGALAVPGPATPDGSATLAWLEYTLDRCGLRLAEGTIDVGSLRECRSGVAELVLDGVETVVDPFKPAPPRLPAPPALQPLPPPPAPAVDAAPPATGQVPLHTLPPPPESAVAAVERATAAPGAPIAAAVSPPAPAGPVPGALDRPAADIAEAVVAARAVDGEHGVASAAPLVWTAADPTLHQRTVSAVLRRGVMSQVVDLLHELELEEDAVLLPVAGHGRGGGRVTRYRGREMVEPLQRIQLQVPVDPAEVDRFVARLTEAARVGEKGDGKIWVT